MGREKTFSPGFRNVHRDIARYIELAGKVEKRRDGSLVYHGYPDAQRLVVDLYLDEKAYEPLVSYLRGWNWEVGDNDLLLDLTVRLQGDGEWELINGLWGGVISKRKKLYRKMERIRRDDPGAIPVEQYEKGRRLLLSAWERLRDLALEMGQVDEVETANRRIDDLRKD